MYDLEILCVYSSCQSTASCKISSSYAQRFMSHRAHKEKNLDKNNTVGSNKPFRQLEYAAGWAASNSQLVRECRTA